GRLHRSRPATDLPARLLHVGRAAGHAVRAVRAAPLAAVLARSAPLPRRVGRADHRVQRSGGAPVITAFRCAVCNTVVDVSVPLAFRCPKATAADPYHVLRLIDDGVGDGVPSGVAGELNPFVRYGRRLAWWAFARANGMTDTECEALTREV